MIAAFTKARRGLATLAAFLLPLGGWGIAGVVAVFLHLLAFARRALPGEGRLLAAAIPLAIITVVATLAQDPPQEGARAFALGMATLLTLGLVTVRRLVASVGADRAAAAFVAGAAVLAVSVVVDAVAGGRAIPSGMFADSLHNHTAAVLVLAFPVALHGAGRDGWRWLGTSAAALLVAGVLAALSWVGAIGLVASALALAALGRKPREVITGVAAGIATVAAATGLALTGPGSVPALATLGEVLSSRARIFAQGLELAGQRPWLGWGVHPADLSGPLGAAGLGLYPVDDLSLPHFHSLYVQTLFETGVVGLMALALLVGYLVTAQRGAWRAATLAALVGFFATQAFDLAWRAASILTSVQLVAALGLAPDEIGPAETGPDETGKDPPPTEEPG